MYFLFTLPFIQTGVSYYISVQVFAFLFFLRFLLLKKELFFYSLFFIPVFFLKYVYSDFLLFDVLRSFKEYLFFLIMISAFYGFKKFSLDKVDLIFRYLVIFLSLLIFIQYYFIHSFAYIPSLPVEFMITNEGTLRDVQYILSEGLRLRPFATFGEPSYAAFVLVFLYYIISTIGAKNYRFYEFLTFFSVLILQSTSGIVTFLFLIFVKYFRLHSVRNFPFFFFFILFISFIVYYSGAFERVASIFFGEADESVQIRYILPVTMLFKIFTEGYIFGVTFTDYLEFSNFGGDNGLFNLFMTYGVLSFFILLIIYIKSDIKLFIFFIFMIMFNGDVFSFDKTVFFGLIFGVYAMVNSKVSFSK